MPDELELMLDQFYNGANPQDIRMHQMLDNLFLEWDKSKPERTGWHLSNIIKPLEKGKNKICYREQVLTKFYKPAPEKQMPVRTIRKFLEGWYIHLKYQTLFRDYGNYIEIEKTRYSKIFDLYHTPDIIFLFQETGNEEWIGEIKSMNSESYEKAVGAGTANRAHPDGYKQTQMYMYLTGIRHGVLILENKDNQEHIEYCFDFDPEFCKPYIHRLNILSQVSDTYKKNGLLPKKICDEATDERACKCPMRNVCFLERKQRESFLITEAKKETEINSSFIHQQKKEKLA